MHGQHDPRKHGIYSKQSSVRIADIWYCMESPECDTWVIHPTKNSEWKVIQSYEGGCPTDVAGNLTGSPASNNSLQLLFTIPETISPGKYTSA